MRSFMAVTQASVKGFVQQCSNLYGLSQSAIFADCLIVKWVSPVRQQICTLSIHPVMVPTCVSQGRLPCTMLGHSEKLRGGHGLCKRSPSACRMYCEQCGVLDTGPPDAVHPEGGRNASATAIHVSEDDVVT